MYMHFDHIRPFPTKTIVLYYILQHRDTETIFKQATLVTGSRRVKWFRA